jgi:predicted 3-demethylubiquinone-9 3-methyltransferase (glyoxalase superfamily)
MSTTPKIQPTLWFAGNAREAAEFYGSIFPSSSVNYTDTYTSAGQEFHLQTPGSDMVVNFTLHGTRFLAINGPPVFKFTEAVSFTINCEDQKEVDYYWDKLTVDGGQGVECGWLKDKYGLSWQVVPNLLNELMMKGTEKQRRALMNAMMGMKKMDVEGLQKVYDEADKK